MLFRSPNPTNIAQVPAAPDNPSVQRLTPVQLGKADVNAAETAADERRVKEALAKLAEDRRLREAKAAADEQRLQNETLAKLAEERLQRIALAKAEEEARIKAAAAKVEADRLQKEAAAQLEEEKRQRIALAKAEEVRSQKEALALFGQTNRNAASTLVSANRKALIFGNDSYQSVPKLKNARADAKSMAEALTGVGYSVRAYYDLNERDMKKAIRDFAGGVSGGDEVLLFYAGHGVQIDNANYLLPVDLHADDARTVRDEAIPLQRVLDDFGDAKAKLTLAIIDACRDNPFKGSGRAIGGRGLASTSAATGQMIMFSAGAGQQALDKVGPNDNSPNGLFTRVFLKHIQQKGITVDRVLRDVRSEVVKIARSIGHEQVPALYDQVVGDFYFAQ